MDDYLDLLIESSAVSAKASLLSALLPVEMPTGLHRELKRSLSAADLDEVIGMCAVMDAASLLAAATYLQTSLHPSYAESFRQRVIYAVALAPVITSFEPHNVDPEVDIHAAVQYLLNRPSDAFLEGNLPVAVEVAVARGAAVKLLTSGVTEDEETTVTEMIWLGTRHEMIAPIAHELQSRSSSDPLLITTLLQDPTPLPLGAYL